MGNDDIAALRGQLREAREMRTDGLRRLHDATSKIGSLMQSLSDVGPRSPEFYEIVAELAKLRPEPGYELLDNAAIGVHLVDCRGNVLWANSCELKTLGYEAHEYLGHSITEFHLDPDVIEHILATLTKGDRLDAYPARLRAADGSIVHVLINSNVFTADEAFVHTRCFTVQVPESVYQERRRSYCENCDHPCNDPLCT